MAGKQILGDDPFGSEPQPANGAPPPAPEPKKEARSEPPPAESYALPVETYPPASEAPPSEYGPSIDRPPAPRRSGIGDEVKQLEERVRERGGLKPTSTGEHGGQRQRLP